MGEVGASQSAQQQRQKASTTQTSLLYSSSPIEGECVLKEVYPIRFVTFRYAVFLVSNVLLMLPWLLRYWYPSLRRLMYYKFCTLEEATDFYIVNADNVASIVEKKSKVVMLTEQMSKHCTYFVNRYMTYLVGSNRTVKALNFDERSRLSKLANGKGNQGLSSCQAHELLMTYGAGGMVIRKPKYIDLLLVEILQPLYIFLFFSVFFWIFISRYYFFAGFVFCTSCLGLFTNLYQLVKLNSKIFSLVHYETLINVLRDGKVQSLSSLEVVPGEVVFFKDHIKVPFDCVVIEGSLMVNECALSGESVPIVKKADLSKYTTTKPIDKNSMVYEGTTIIQVNDHRKMNHFEKYRQSYGVPACVTATNFATNKGQLIRSILYPKQRQDHFLSQSYRYLLSLFCVSVATYIALVSFIHPYTTPGQLADKFFELIFITVPPVLPVSLTFGLVFCIYRLEKKKIFCISQSKVVAGGLVELCCFDKTGTLTEDHMNFYSLLPCIGAKFDHPLLNNQTDLSLLRRSSSQLSPYHDIMTNMACNHSIVSTEANQKLLGDPMEVTAFEVGDFKMTGPPEDDQEAIYGFSSERGHSGVVYRRFAFESQLQRMSVACKDQKSQQCRVYVKGSPEQMFELMQPASIPKKYQQVLREYASHGFRVLSIASKSIDCHLVPSLTRQEAESKLIFDGFLVFENKLKPQTTPSIAQIRSADIDCLMITGDNNLTACCISYQCGISEQQRGTIICDFKDSHFTEEPFDFRRQVFRQESSINHTQPKTPIQIQLISLDVSKIKEPLYPRRQSSYQISQVLSTRLQDICQPPLIKPEGAQGDFMAQILKKASENDLELCLSGAAFNKLFPGSLETMTPTERKFLQRVKAFARTTPKDKVRIVNAYQSMGLGVSMCGDGANDCGALKQTDLGLSLSQAEASISATFTSQESHIRAMVELIKECRGGLVTSYSLFNIMVTFALIMYTTTVITQKFLQYPTDEQYLWWDLTNFLLVFLIGYTEPAQRLSKTKPKVSLFTLTNLLSVISAFGMQLAAQVVVIAVFEQVDPDYYSAQGGLDNAITQYESLGYFPVDRLQGDVLFVFINNIYMATLLSFTISRPWRRHFVTNLPLMVAVVSLSIYHQMLILWKGAGWAELSPNYMGSLQLREAVFGLSIFFSVAIYCIQVFALRPLCQRLVEAYPQYKWL